MGRFNNCETISTCFFMKKILIIILILFILTLIQTSFLVHFSIWGVFPNLILVLVSIFNFFEDPVKKLGILTAGIGGFFLDIYSNSFIGALILTLIAISLIFKGSRIILKERPQKHPLIYFIPLFVFALVFYDFFFGFTLIFVNSFHFSFDLSLLIKIAYNLVLALIGFYLFKRFSLYEFFLS